MLAGKLLAQQPLDVMMVWSLRTVQVVDYNVLHTLKGYPGPHYLYHNARGIANNGMLHAATMTKDGLPIYNSFPSAKL